MKNTECCAPFDPKVWDGRTHTWKNKLFLHDTVAQVLHIPLNMGSVVTRMMRKIEDAGVMPASKDFLMLCYDPSPWRSEIYMTIPRNILGEDVRTLSGTFVSRVFDGPYHFVPKWIKEMDVYLDIENQTALKYYFHYAYCPKCAKKYGHNYCVAFAQVK